MSTSTNEEPKSYPDQEESAADAVKASASLNADDQQMEQELHEKICGEEESPSSEDNVIDEVVDEPSSEDIQLGVIKSAADEVVGVEDEVVEDLGAEEEEKVEENVKSEEVVPDDNAAKVTSESESPDCIKDECVDIPNELCNE